MSKSALEVWCLAVILGSTSWAQVTQRVSVDSGGAQGNDASGNVSISADGRYVAFTSSATNLVPGDTNGVLDAFVRDRLNGTTERVSVDSGGTQGNQQSGSYSISADGRFVAFLSGATNLVPGDTNARFDIFVRDRLNGTTERVSVDSGGIQGNFDSFDASISADGRYVAFYSDATNLVLGDTNGAGDVFVHDRQSGTTERVSVDSSGGQANGVDTFYNYLSISADGRYVAFYSAATNLVLGDTNGFWDVFVRDRLNGTTERVSVDSSGAQGDSFSHAPAMSANGRYVAFYSAATNLVPGDTNGAWDVFVRDRQSGTTERVSVNSSGGQAGGENYHHDPPSISADGRYVAFVSFAFNLVPGDTNGSLDVFVRDRQSGTTERESVDSGGLQGNSQSRYPSISSANGRYVAFESSANNLVPGDTNLRDDAFVRDRSVTRFTSLCDPGVFGMIACPCSNPPSGPGRGCDNSASTGGAILSASGTANLSADSLVLTTSGENPTALSIVVQGSALISSGLVYGQGVRCLSGTLKRLYVKSAHGGSITAPDFFVGDPYITQRSAALGDPIQPGQSRCYLVYYRDPVVLGGCPSSSTFNATQTGQVAWAP